MYKHASCIEKTSKFLTLSVISVLLGCGSTASTSAPGPSPAGQSAPTVVTASDAPLSNILSAVVTISSASLTSGTTNAPIISAPVAVELSSLGAVQEPIELTNLAYGTYSAVNLTVSSAVVTYVNTGGQTVTTTATLTQPTVTVALTPALVISNTAEAQVQLAFNLAQSFSITGTTVTFGPAINTVGTLVSAENSGDRQVEVTGAASAISASGITIQSGDSGRTFAFTVNSTTQFPTGVTIASIQAGAIVQVQGQTQTDGTILATMITQESAEGNSGQAEDGAKGIVTAVTTSGGVLTGFTMVPRQSFGSHASTLATAGIINVAVSSSTSYTLPEDAVQAGIASSAFTSTTVVPGQSVVVSGASSTAGTLTAQQVTLAAESVAGTLAPSSQSTASTLVFGLTLPSTSILTTYDHLTGINVTTSQSTEYGGSLTAVSLASLAAGTSAATTTVEVHAYLVQGVGSNFVLYATGVSQVETPETPEAPETPGNRNTSSGS